MELELRAMRVLCFDIEGGHGGSSRSLYYLLKNIDRGVVYPEVWCRRGGPILALYEELGIPCHVEPKLPRFTVTENGFRKNFNNVRHEGPSLLRAGNLVRRLARDINARFDVVHFNHPAFFLLARWLRRLTNVPFIMHIRTRPPDNILARWQARQILKTMDHLVFITENEQEWLARLAGEATGTVIYNARPDTGRGPEAHPSIPLDGRFKIASLSNFSWPRGVDRLVDIAVELEARGNKDVLFVLAGDMHLQKNLPGRLGELGLKGATLADYANECGVVDSFLFLGHVPDPENVLFSCDVLVKPTREDNPWGRDIIESLHFGRPVITIGTWGVFVINGETGLLHAKFDAAAMAEDIIKLSDDRILCKSIGTAGQTLIANLCSPKERAADLLGVWQRAAADFDGKAKILAS
jgi:glycosyltransferase involved in cell wall biosynthesis